MELLIVVSSTNAEHRSQGQIQPRNGHALCGFFRNSVHPAFFPFNQLLNSLPLQRPPTTNASALLSSPLISLSFLSDEPALVVAIRV